MKTTFAALTALLVCAGVSLGWAPASAQGPASAQRAAAAPRASRQPAPGSAAARAVPPASSAPTASAARSAPVYRVELVVFRAVRTIGTPEDWAAEAGAPSVAPTDVDPESPSASAQPQGADAAGPASAKPPSGSPPPAGAQAPNAPSSLPAAASQTNGPPPSIVVRLLPAADFQLDGVASRLRASGRYVPIAHIGWAQTASPWGKPVEIAVQSVGLDTQGVTGTVALERGQFLHLVLDLRYTMSDPPGGLDAPPGTVFVLDQSHRVRLRERNYFDHPAFGVIALVTSDSAPQPVRP